MPAKAEKYSRSWVARIVPVGGLVAEPRAASINAVLEKRDTIALSKTENDGDKARCHPPRPTRTPIVFKVFR